MLSMEEEEEKRYKEYVNGKLRGGVSQLVGVSVADHVFGSVTLVQGLPQGKVQKGPRVASLVTRV